MTNPDDVPTMDELRARIMELESEVDDLRLRIDPEGEDDGDTEFPQMREFPETMECYECGGFNGRDFKVQRVIRLGPVVEAHRDATQTYVLECGHTVI
jgi:hypothetical protein